MSTFYCRLLLKYTFKVKHDRRVSFKGKSNVLQKVH